eukprot:m.106555 g.106555  ORF g.106555 m.106555 type:complete len:1046 (+) comp27733_c0_seq1:221-3358(+)
MSSSRRGDCVEIRLESETGLRAYQLLPLAAQFIPALKVQLQRRDQQPFVINGEYEISTLTFDIIKSCLEKWSKKDKGSYRRYATEMCEAPKNRKELLRLALAAHDLRIEILKDAALEVIVSLIQGSTVIQVMDNFKISEKSVIMLPHDSSAIFTEREKRKQLQEQLHRARLKRNAAGNESDKSKMDEMILELTRREEEAAASATNIDFTVIETKETDEECAMPNCQEQLFAGSRHTCRICYSLICPKCTRYGHVSPAQMEAFHAQQKRTMTQDIMSMTMRMGKALVRGDMRDTNKEFMCSMCSFDTASSSKKIKIAEKVFRMCMGRSDRVLTLKELLVMKNVCEVWGSAVHNILDMLLGVQQYMHTQKLTKFEERFLNHNRAYLVEHPRWMIQLLRAADWQTTVYPADFLASSVPSVLPLSCEDVQCNGRLCLRHQRDNSFNADDTDNSVAECQCGQPGVDRGALRTLAPEHVVEILCGCDEVWRSYAVLIANSPIGKESVQCAHLTRLRQDCIEVLRNVWPPKCERCSLDPTAAALASLSNSIKLQPQEKLKDAARSLWDEVKETQRCSTCDCKASNSAAEKVILEYLPGLVRALWDEGIDPMNSQLYRFLLNSAARSMPINMSLYWALQQQSRCDDFPQGLVRAHLAMAGNLRMHSHLLLGHLFVDALKKTSKGISNKLNAKECLAKSLTQLGLVLTMRGETLVLKEPFLLPVRTDFWIMEIDLKSVKVLSSKQAPLVFKVRGATGDTQPIAMENPTTDLTLAFKAEDMRKDWVIMNVIRKMGEILNADEHVHHRFGEIPVVTYGVVPVERDYGLIEFVSGAITVTEIQEKKSSVAHWLIDEKDKIEVEGYLKSFAASTVMCYMLGLGDRHNENLMLTPDGLVFHIDFGYVVGEEPKLKVITPTINLREDMMAPLGSVDGKMRRDFLELASLTYKTLRKHTPMFYTMLMEIANAKPQIENVSQGDYKKELSHRFAIGETDDSAVKHFEEVLEAAFSRKSQIQGTLYNGMHKFAIYAEDVKKSVKKSIPSMPSMTSLGSIPSPF